MILDHEFYIGPDVVKISRNLLGKVLYTFIDDQITSGKIVETEAYCGLSDRASHAYPNKMTQRNKIMFETGGVAYVYFIYGMHHMFNIVTGEANLPNAVLIRALEPVEGIEVMCRRRKRETINRITSGPGSLSRAMGIDLRLNGHSLISKKIWIEDTEEAVPGSDIVATSRIGIDYAGEDASLNWRFYIKDNPWISKKG